MKNIEYDIQMEFRVIAEQDSEKIKKIVVDTLYSIDETTNIIVDNYALKKVSLVEVEGDDN